MADDKYDDQQDDREVDSLRAAFVQQAGGVDAPDADAVRRGVRRRSRLRIGAAALAVIVVTGGIVTGVQLAGQHHAATPATGPDPMTATTTASADLPDGWHYVYYGNAQVGAPASWGYERAPASDWCIGDGKYLPKQPYVSLERSDVVIASIGCGSTDPDGGLPVPDVEGGAPSRLWVDHVEVHRLYDGDRARSDQIDGWWFVQRPVGNVLVRAVTQSKELANQIVDSAQQVDDPGGCASTSPVESPGFPRPDPAFDVSTVDSVDSITVCQYELGLFGSGPVGGGLVGVRTMTGSEADDELAAIKAAPEGGGPDTPDSCTSDYYGSSAIALELTSGDTSHTMYVYYSSCRGNGFDDGTSRRELTLDSCSSLMVEPIEINGGSSAPFERCYVRQN